MPIKKVNRDMEADAEGVQLVKRMGSSDARERIRAEAQLQQSGLNTVESILALYKAEHDKWFRTQRVLKLIRNALFIVFAVAYILWTGQMPHIGLFLTLFIVTGIFSTLLHMETRRAYSKGIALALTRFDDVSMIGPLIVLYRKNWDTKEVVIPVLTRLLPRLKTSDAALLNEWQRERLYSELDTCVYHSLGNTVNVEFICAILKALEQVGDAKALPHVEKLARFAKSQHIRQTAQDCLPFFQQCAEQRHISSSLLRPSAPASSSSELVRPATDSKKDKTLLLLRASALDQEGGNKL